MITSSLHQIILRKRRVYMWDICFLLTSLNNWINKQSIIILAYFKWKTNCDICLPHASRNITHSKEDTRQKPHSIHVPLEGISEKSRQNTKDEIMKINESKLLRKFRKENCIFVVKNCVIFYCKFDFRCSLGRFGTTNHLNRIRRIMW